MAIGSHAENGNCALFEQAAIRRKINVNIGYSLFIRRFQFVDIINIPIDIKIKISPIRFLNKVMEPDLAEEWFW